MKSLANTGTSTVAARTGNGWQIAVFRHLFLLAGAFSNGLTISAVLRVIRPVLALVAAGMLLGGCSADEKSDAYGQFEATEITVSSEVGGKLMAFEMTEGELVEAGLRVGWVDTTQLHLNSRELEAQLEAGEARMANIEAETDVVREELALARTDLNRIRALEKESAATQKQLDDARGRVRTLEKRVRALQTQKRSVRAEMRSIHARLDQVADRIKKSLVINPVRGTVLTTFVERHELVGQGQPLFQIADLDTLELRVFVSGAQMPNLKLGRQVEVLVDKNAKENQRMSGSVSWIASEAEFTPKMIQTKEERVNQVYAVKIRVPNPDGVLKIGMPGEVNF